MLSSYILIEADEIELQFTSCSFSVCGIYGETGT